MRGEGGVIDPPVKTTPFDERDPKNLPITIESCQKEYLCIP